MKLKNQQQTDPCGEHDRRKAQQIIFEKNKKIVLRLFCFVPLLFATRISLLLSC